MDISERKRLLRLQRMEATEAEVYRRLAKMQKDPVNRSILEGIALEEERHEAVIAKMTGEEVKADKGKVTRQIVLARLLGFTFSIKMMESNEHHAASEYRELGLHDIAEEEELHVQSMISMLDEERLRYSGSIVLGLSDALVELTGALAGLTFALQDLNLVALAGLVTGIAAAFSMGASEYLSSRAEKKSESAVKAAFFTWISYLLTVLMLVAPFLVFQADSPEFHGLGPHVQALMFTFAIGLLIVALFNFFLSVVEEASFKSRFLEMTGILGVVSLISYGIGIALRGILGVEI
ncbi:MAG: VIT1/CCC1 family protein [Candidatus Thalassarchaeaceae archaeon]|nr:VIT1/CCC1 family protein [Candidatus Thalassarchaeaceae archaeon]MDP7257102.1 VIT1/CCC1 family protein [Candidatus Thalassarchaeaceae archaeon]MDP7445701.1 VIT1/CCC1 family protein [Candidatus Thalassarchaeaceae archaeon]MDP7649726.1 VIT1/CCC1 family protein [Candidatus Thalassarchaeaceae archaeon]HJL55208.1 VIT1/CCC1 family protein [Candidatus Thalassarchaeaceae archaeon]